MHRIRFALVAMFVLALASAASAQSNACDTAPPTSGTALAGDPEVIHVCWAGLDTNGNPATPTGWKFFDNALPAVPITMVKGATSSVSGLTEWTGSFVAPATKGVHTLSVSVVTAKGEAQAAIPFALTVTLPASGPVPPVKVTVTPGQ